MSSPLPVLETGGGGVTLCEVHLRAGPGFGVLVEPRTHDDIRADVSDFADHLTGASTVDGGGGGGDVEAFRSVPTEVERAIRNMAGLQPKRTKQPDGTTLRSDPRRNSRCACNPDASSLWNFSR